MKRGVEVNSPLSEGEHPWQKHGVHVRGLLEFISDLIWETDADGCATFFGPRLKTFTGYTAGEVVGKPLSSLFRQDDERAFAELFRSDATPEHASSVETVLRRADGSQLAVEVTIAPLFDAGKLVAYHGVLKDISERKHVELSLKRSELLLSNALSLTNAGPWEYDVQSDLFLFNDMFYAIFGTTAEEVGTYEMTPDDYAERFVHPDERHVVRNGIKLFLETPDPNYNRYLEHRFLYANGKIGQIAVRFHILKDASGRTIKCYGVNQDITQQKNAESIKSEFISTVTHELRTPLTSVVGSLGLLRSGAFGEFSKKAARMINLAYDNGTRLAHLINDMLEIDKIEAGQLVFKIGVSNLKELLEEAADLNGAFADQRGVTIGLNPVPPDLMVETDPDRFQQVMANLISNALKFSPKGETITISARMVGPAVRIGVADRGPGIPHEFRNRMFQRFAQADGSDTRRTGGTGLGLSASKAMVERMGGQIGYTTKEGVGTTFYFDLLAHRQSEHGSQLRAPGKVSIQSLYPESRARGPIARVLHIEQDADTRAIVAECIADVAQVDAVTTAAEARSLLDLHTFDLVVLAMRLSDEQGDSLLNFLQERRAPRPPVLVFSAVDVDTSKWPCVTRALVKSRTDIVTLRRTVLRLLGIEPSARSLKCSA